MTKFLDLHRLDDANNTLRLTTTPAIDVFCRNGANIDYVCCPLCNLKTGSFDASLSLISEWPWSARVWRTLRLRRCSFYTVGKPSTNHRSAVLTTLSSGELVQASDVDLIVNERASTHLAGGGVDILLKRKKQSSKERLCRLCKDGKDIWSCCTQSRRCSASTQRLGMVTDRNRAIRDHVIGFRVLHAQ